MTETLKGFVMAYWDLFPKGYPGLKGDEKDTLTAQTFQENEASQAVLKKCGFECWKKEEEEIKGEKITMVWYRLWRPEQGKARVVPGRWYWSKRAEERHHKNASIRNK